MFICVYVCAYIEIYIFIHIHYIYSYISLCLDIYIHTYIYMYVYMCVFPISWRYMSSDPSNRNFSWLPGRKEDPNKTTTSWNTRRRTRLQNAMPGDPVDIDLYKLSHKTYSVFAIDMVS